MQWLLWDRMEALGCIVCILSARLPAYRPGKCWVTTMPCAPPFSDQILGDSLMPEQVRVAGSGIFCLGISQKL